MYSERDSTRLEYSQELPEQKKYYFFNDHFHEDVGRLVHSPSYRKLAKKRQLFPNDDSDFVRNRLTHSCEVAQIATSIGAWLNKSPTLRGHNQTIRSDLLIFAGLAHDLGHPPYGHTGETALNERMWDSGGFEGNAQTLRILTSLEKRMTRGQMESIENGEILLHSTADVGINATLRSIASILKYDVEIPIFDGHSLPERRKPKLTKGYYQSEAKIVGRIRRTIGGKEFEELSPNVPDFKTIEAQIMDFADDIAYSIYDLEDCFKTGTLSPLDFLSAPESLLAQIGNDMAEKIADDMAREAVTTAKRKATAPISAEELETVYETTRRIKFELFAERLTARFLTKLSFSIFLSTDLFSEPADSQPIPAELSRMLDLYQRSMLLRDDEKFRRRFTEKYIGNCIRSCQLKYDEKNPTLSVLSIGRDEYLKIEFLKRFNYHKVIQSDLLQISERRCNRVIKRVFDCLYLPGDEFKGVADELTGFSLLPHSIRLKILGIYKEHPVAGNFVEMCWSHIRNLPGLYPSVPKHYDLQYMLSFLDYSVRFELLESILRAVRELNISSEQSFVNAQTRKHGVKRVICDFICSQTDRSIEELHDRLYLDDRRKVYDV